MDEEPDPTWAEAVAAFETAEPVEVVTEHRGSVLWNERTIMVTAPADATLNVGFYDADRRCFDSETVPAGETRTVGKRGAYITVTIMPEGFAP